MKLINYDNAHNGEIEAWLDQAFRSFGRWPALDGLAPSTAAGGPPLSLYEDENSYHLQMEVPGFSKDNLQIEWKENVLTVSGERKEGERQASFKRSTRVPQDVECGKIEARCVDGILTVDLPKKEQARPRAIKIA